MRQNYSANRVTWEKHFRPDSCCSNSTLAFFGKGSAKESCCCPLTCFCRARMSRRPPQTQPRRTSIAGARLGFPCRSGNTNPCPILQQKFGPSLEFIFWHPGIKHEQDGQCTSESSGCSGGCSLRPFRSPRLPSTSLLWSSGSLEERPCPTLNAKVSRSSGYCCMVMNEIG